MRGSNQGDRRGLRSGQQARGGSPAASRGTGGAGGRSRGGAGGAAADSPAGNTGSHGGSYNAVPPPAALMASGSGSNARGGRGSGSGYRGGNGYSGSTGSYGSDSGSAYAAGAPESGGNGGGNSGGRAYNSGSYGGSPYGQSSPSYGGARGGGYGARALDSPGGYGSSPAGRAGRHGASQGQQGAYDGGAHTPHARPMHFCIEERDWGLLAVRADAKTQSIFELSVATGERFSGRWLAAVSRWAANVARKHPNFPRDHREQAAAAADAAASMVLGKRAAHPAASETSGTAEGEASLDNQSDAGASANDALDMVAFLQQQRQQESAESGQQSGIKEVSAEAQEQQSKDNQQEPAPGPDPQHTAQQHGSKAEAKGNLQAAESSGSPAAAAAAAPAAVGPGGVVAGEAATPGVSAAATVASEPGSASPAGGSQVPSATATADDAPAAPPATTAPIAEPTASAAEPEGLVLAAEPLSAAPGSIDAAVAAAKQPPAELSTSDIRGAAPPAMPEARDKDFAAGVEDQLQVSPMDEHNSIQTATARPTQQAQQALSDSAAEPHQPVQHETSVRENAAAAEGAEKDEQLTGEQILLPVTGAVRQHAQQEQQEAASISIRVDKAAASSAGEDGNAAENVSAAPGATQGLIQQDTASKSATGSSSHKAQDAGTAARGPAGTSVSPAAAAAAAAATEARLAALADQPRDRGDAKQAWRCRVSLRLERQAITDEEMRLLADWHALITPALDLFKLWLYDNRIGDEGAAAIARIVAAAPALSELHLSHNQIATAGAKALLGAVAPGARPPGLKPLWLRLEYNELDADALRHYAQEDCALRGLLVDIASEVPADRRHGHEKNMKWHMKHGVAHVQLPWLSCQRQAPSEAKVLLEARQAWARTAAASAAANAAARGGAKGAAGEEAPRRMELPPPPIPASAASEGATAAAEPAATVGAGAPGPSAAGSADPVVSKLQAWVSTGPSKKRPAPRAAGAAAASSAPAAQLASSSAAASEAGAGSAAGEGEGGVDYMPGPLLLFPDTSAVLSMLGANGLQGRTVLSMGVLQSLAEHERFGRGLAPEQQTFIVLSDAVVKQLDSLKNEDGPGRLVRRLMGEGLDQLGPKGLDILTVLGAHEGEGLVLDRNANVAGSRSTSSSGQRSDLSIVEVALFYKSELCAAATAAISKLEGGEAGAERQLLPVVLLTNDNGQLQVAKAHGLPALRITGSPELDAALKAHLKLGGNLTSTDLRRIMGPAALAGLGAAAGRSVQDEFDGAVACLRGLLDAYQDMAGLVQNIDTTLSSIDDDPQGVITTLRDVLATHNHVTPFSPATSSAPAAAVKGTSMEPRSPTLHAAASDTAQATTPSAAAGSKTGVLGSSQATIAALQEKLKGWDQVVKSHQAPSRVAKWSNGM